MNQFDMGSDDSRYEGVGTKIESYKKETGK